MARVLACRALWCRRAGRHLSTSRTFASNMKGSLQPSLTLRAGCGYLLHGVSSRRLRRCETLYCSCKLTSQALLCKSLAYPRLRKRRHDEMFKFACNVQENTHREESSSDLPCPTRHRFSKDMLPGGLKGRNIWTAAGLCPARDEQHKVTSIAQRLG